MNLLREYVSIARPRVMAMALAAVAVGQVLGAGGEFDGVLFLHAAFGTSGVVAGCFALNQWLERDVDARMGRTRGRPLPSGRFSGRHMVLFGAVSAAAGLGHLAYRVNPASAALCGASLLLYVFVYTPLKRRTAWNTVVGAIPGAMPPVIGWAAATGGAGAGAWALFGIVFLWQFPHFMSIAWLYRDEYRAAGLRMVTVGDADGRRTGAHAVAWCVALLGVSALPYTVGIAGPAYLAWAGALGALYLGSALVFARERSDSRARWLLRASVVYLPVLLAAPLFAETTDRLSLAATPAPPPSHAGQTIFVQSPTPGQAIPVTGSLTVAYTTDDGAEAAAFIDGRAYGNGEEVRLVRLGTGRHAFRAHPFCCPGSAQEFEFDVVPGITIVETDASACVRLVAEPWHLARLDPASVEVVGINGSHLSIPVPANAPPTLIPRPEGSILQEIEIDFAQADLLARTGGVPAKRLEVVGVLAETPRFPRLEFRLLDAVDPDVPPSGTTNKFAFDRAWGNPNPADVLDRPTGLAVDRASRFVYVVDETDNHVVKYDLSGNFQGTVGGSGFGTGLFLNAMHVGVSSDGQSVYVTDGIRAKVLKFDGQGRFAREFGAFGSGDGRFQVAGGVDVHPGTGEVYVSDPILRRVQRFSSDGQFLGKFGTAGTDPGEFQSPQGLAVDASGNVYVVDQVRHKVLKFNAAGGFLFEFGGMGGGSGLFSTPFDILWDPQFDLVGVTDQGNNLVQFFDAGTGTFAGQLGGFGTEPGRFRAPQGLDVDLEGIGPVYVADSTNQNVTKFLFPGVLTWGRTSSLPPGVGARVAVDNLGRAYFTTGTTVQKWDVQGGFLFQWGSLGSGDGQFNAAQDVAVSPDGQRVYVADSGNSRVQVFDATGAFLLKWGTSGTAPGEFGFIRALEADEQGNVYVCEDGRVQKFSSTGTFLLQWGTPGTGDGEFSFGPRDIAIDRPAGRVYTLEQGNVHSVQVFSLSGAFLDNWGTIPGEGRFLRGIAVDQEAGGPTPRDGVYLARTGGWSKWHKDRTFVAQYINLDGTDASVSSPRGIAVDTGDSVYVTDFPGFGATGRAKKFLQGHALPPTAIAGPDRTVAAYTPATLDGSLSHDNGLGSLVSAIWEFDDGSPAGASPAESGLVVQHRFYTSGVFTATLTVADDSGNTASDSAQITVVSGPVAMIEVSPVPPVAAGTVLTFSGAGSTDLLGTIQEYRWIFGDGETAEGVEAQHFFPLPGVYTVFLTVEDNQGLTGTASIGIEVTSGVPGEFADLEALIRQVTHPGTRNSLLSKLRAAREAFARGDADAALNILDAILREVAAQEGRRIPGALAQEIRAQVGAIRERMEAEAEGAVTAAPVGSTDGLVGVTARILPQDLAVRVLEGGAPLAGEAVSFRVVEGMGAIVRSFELGHTTDDQGVAGVRFLCPSRAGFSRVHAVRDVVDPDTQEVREQVLAEWAIRTRAPSLRIASDHPPSVGTAQSRDGPVEVFRENAAARTFTVRMGDATNAPYEGQDIEYRITNGAGTPLSGNRGILLPSVQLTDAQGKTHAAYVSEDATQTGTVFIEARPLPPVEDEFGYAVAATFPAVTVSEEPESDPFFGLGGYDAHDIVRGNGQVVLPGGGTGTDIRVRYAAEPVFPTPEPPFVFFHTSAQNTLQTTVGSEFHRSTTFGGLQAVGVNALDQGGLTGVTFVGTQNDRRPKLLQGRGSTPFHGSSDMAVGMPEARLVKGDGAGGFEPAPFVAPASLADILEGRAVAYFVEARLPVGQQPPVTGGVRSLDIGRDDELPARPEWVAPTDLSGLAFAEVPGVGSGRYTLWRTVAPVYVTQEEASSGFPAPVAPPGVLQAVELGAVQAFVQVGGTAFPDGELRGIRVGVPLLAAYDADDDRIAFGTAASDPHPTIELDPVSLANVQDFGEGIVAVLFEGTVRDALADAVEGGLADIAEVTVEGQSIPVERVPDDHPADPRRPYPFKGRFRARAVVPIGHGDNMVFVTARNAAGREGHAGFSVRAVVGIDEERTRDPEVTPAVYLGGVPMVLSLPESFDTDDLDSIGVGFEGVGEPDPVVETGDDTRIFSGATPLLEEVEVSLPDYGTLDPDAPDEVAATIISADVGLSRQTLVFRETGDDTRIFRLTSRRLRARLAALSDATVDTLEVAVDEEGAVGSFGSLTETEVSSRLFEGSHPDLGVVSVLLTGANIPDPDIAQGIVASVTAPSVGLRGATVTLDETGPATDEYAQDALGFGLGGTSLGEPTYPFRVEIVGVELTEPTSEGLVNPVLVRYRNPAAASSGQIDVAGRFFATVADPASPGARVTDRPLFFIAGGVPEGIPNLFDAEDEVFRTARIALDGLAIRTGHFITTASDSPRVPRGVNRVPVAIRHGSIASLPVFDRKPLADLAGTLDLTPIRPGGLLTDFQVRIDEVQHAGDDVLTLFLTVSGDHPPGAIGVLGNITVGGDAFPFELDRVFVVSNLKLLIVALDGGGYQALVDATARSESNSVLREMLAGPIDRQFDPGRVLNSMPTVTYTNWATWLTGQTPAQHGITGNAFFPRDRLGVPGDPVFQNPFGCANRSGIEGPGLLGKAAAVAVGANLDVPAGVLDDKDDARSASFSGLVRLLRDSGQLLQRAPGVGSSLFVHSHYVDIESRPGHVGVTFATASLGGPTAERLGRVLRTNDRATPHVTARQGIDLETLAGHGETSAGDLDRHTGRIAREVIEGVGPSDVTFLYFPGPDNYAHESKAEDLPSAGMPMTRAIVRQIADVTAVQIQEVWDRVKERGYEVATLVVFIADHGLIATPQRVVAEERVGRVLQRRLAAIYEGVPQRIADGSSPPPTLWRGGTDSIEDSNVVHAPSGGMAQVYLRGVVGGVDSWRGAPLVRNVRDMAARLDAEARGILPPGATPFDPTFQDRLAILRPGTPANRLQGVLWKQTQDDAAPDAPTTFARPFVVFSPGVPGLAIPLADSAGPLILSGTDRHMREWVEAGRRINEEFNDVGLLPSPGGGSVGTPSRTGEVILLMDTVAGVRAVHDADHLTGWHGGATRAESEVPMRWFYAGGENSDLLAEVERVLGAVSGRGPPRTIHFRDTVLGVLRAARGNAFGGGQ